ncbi:hypothetical protein [Sphingomonas bacterium]|uniref:hypothetical protein n=1 Tax=Sphingomonas bacterium TaxID=1895847 RepID=UPI0020C6ADFC|nr:hypothetical protein [Sphingomonas bacterium]
MDIITELKWAAAGTGMVAATIVALDLGKRDTGWGMVLFCVSALAWIAGGLLTRDWALGTQNVVLLVIDLIGVYRYFTQARDQSRQE